MSHDMYREQIKAASVESKSASEACLGLWKPKNILLGIHEKSYNFKTSRASCSKLLSGGARGSWKLYLGKLLLWLL